MLTGFVRKSHHLKSVKGAAVVLVAGAIALYACSKDDDGSGASIGAPQAYPPTAAVTPGQLVLAAGTGSSSFVGKKTAASRANPDSAASLASAASAAALGTLVAVEPSTDSEKTAMLDTVKQRLFSEGPTNLLKLVKNVDDRMKEYDGRVASMSTAPECLSSTPVDLSTVFSVPAASGTTTFPLFGQFQ